jgi:hypothetical protein
MPGRVAGQGEEVTVPRLLPPALAVLAALTLAACSSDAPTPGPSSSFPVAEVVDEVAFGALAAGATAGDKVAAYELVRQVCGSTLTPTEQAETLDPVTVRFAVLAGCPEKADWDPSGP